MRHTEGARAPGRGYLRRVAPLGAAGADAGSRPARARLRRRDGRPVLDGYGASPCAREFVHLTGGPPRRRAARAGKVDGKGRGRGLEHLHLVTYTLATDKYVDHGPIFYSDRIGFPTYVNSIAVGGDGWVYALGRMPSGLTDLFRVADPHA